MVRPGPEAEVYRRGVGLTRVTVLFIFLNVSKYPVKATSRKDLSCPTVHEIQVTQA